MMPPAGNQMVLETEGSQTVAIVRSTGGFDHFRELPMGTLTLKPGVNRLLMRPRQKLRGELADVRAVRLVPVGLGRAASSR